MALPDPRKKKRAAFRDDPRTLSKQDEDNLTQIAELLDCGNSTSGILVALQAKKSSCDMLRTLLKLPSSAYFALDGMIPVIEQIQDAAGLEVVLEEVLDAYPFKKADLLVSVCKAGRFRQFEATLSARERTELPRSTMPMVDVIELREKKTALLQSVVASSIMEAVEGLKR